MDKNTKTILIIAGSLLGAYLIYKVAKNAKENKLDKEDVPEGTSTVSVGSKKAVVAPLLDIFKIKLNPDGTFTIHHKDDKNFKYPYKEWKGRHTDYGKSIVFDKGYSFTNGTLQKNINAIETVWRANVSNQDIKDAEERAKKMLAISSNPALSVFI